MSGILQRPDDAHYELMERAVELRIRGKQPREIATELKIKRYEVDDLLSEWQYIISNDSLAVARSQEALANADRHYNDLIKNAWEIVEQADSVPDDPKFMAQKNSALKLIGDLEHKRFSMLKEMGALQNNDIASEIAERERREEIIMDILRDVICEKCKPEVTRRLAQLNGQVAPIQVVVDES
jgi:hypothetical protein